MYPKAIIITVLILLIAQAPVYARPGTVGNLVEKNAPDPDLPDCDLGAEMIDFEIVKQIDSQTVRVKIIGKVKNLGKKDFIADKNLASARLYESSTTPDNLFSMVVEKEILSIPVGEFFTFEYERNWEISDLDKFGGQPCYRLEVKYSPAILQDDNPNNDDSKAKNNVRERTTKQLRRIWAVFSKNAH